MSKPIIKVNNLSKRYRIGTRERGYKTFREAIVDGIMAPIRNLKRLNRLTKFDDYNAKRPTGDIIWALKDVTFTVNEGEVLGIIGRNGAGKTTLLKILSRITEPTEGYAEIKGKVGSLLEVGTGFHPELTGRENIYLNGSILGMRGLEIKKKFDEIVSFAGIDKFIDTPLKYYSSGMSVRLAFSVAAHLQPEILLLDEVLAVGDLAFQKRCFEKMGDIIKEGRIILLVSHNLQAINSLCSRAICLENGRIVSIGETRKVVNGYLKNIEFLKTNEDISKAKRAIASDYLKFARLTILNSKGEKSRTICFRETFEVDIVFKVLRPIEEARIGVTIWTPDGIGISTTHHTDGGLKILSLREGLYNISTRIENLLIPGNYILSVGAHDLRTSHGLDFVPEAATFTVSAVSEKGTYLHDPYNRSFTYLPAQWREVTHL